MLIKNLVSLFLGTRLFVDFFFFALLIFSLHAVTKTLNELHWKAYINISIILTCVIFCHAISHCHLYMDKLHSFYRLLHTFLHRKRILVHNFLGLYVPLGSLGLFHIVSLSFWHFFSRIFLLFFYSVELKNIAWICKMVICIRTEH